MPRPGYRTAAQKKGARMRARGRNYRGGFTRGEIASGDHKKQTCRVRGCPNRQTAAYCKKHREEDD